MSAAAETVFPVFVGRGTELAVLRSALDRSRAGRPQVVIVEGPAGIGKTALVDRFLLASHDLTVLRAGGEPWEALVPFGLVDQLLRSAGFSRARLLATRERSLPADEPIGVGRQVLELLDELAARRPVVLVVDDAHWSDLDSLRAVLFAVRRLVDQPVLTVLTVRPEEVQRLPDGLRRLADGGTGTTVRPAPLAADEVEELATSMGVREFSLGAASRLHAHTEGNPLYARALLTEVLPDQWRTWQPVLPAPRAFAALVARRLDSCTADGRRLVQAAAVLGRRSPMSLVVALGEVQRPPDAVEEASVAGLLHSAAAPGSHELSFPHPLVQAAVYGQLTQQDRDRLHARAAGLVPDPGAALRHRVAATHTADPAMAEELERYGRQQANRGAWARAASAFVDASRLSADRSLRESRLLRAVDAMVGAGDLHQAGIFAREIRGFPAGAMRDAALGYLAVVHGRPTEAEALLHRAWRHADPVHEPGVAATIAQRLALSAVGRLDGPGIVDFSRRTVELAAPGEPVRAEAQAVLGLGLAWNGRLDEGLRLQEAALAELSATAGDALAPRISMAHGWLRLADDDVVGARIELMETAPAALAQGSVRISMWAYCWLAQCEFSMGDWDDAVLDAERAVTLLDDSGHAWLRPLAHWSAAVVPAARGEWAVAEEHVRSAVAQSGDYELMVAGCALARSALAAAHGDNDGVVRALEPLLSIRAREAIEEPGFWPWRDLYADALLGVGRLDGAEALLEPWERLAEDRGRRAETARLARVRGRLESARGRPERAEDAFRHALQRLGELPLPFDRALIEFARGQALRRAGHRRDAAIQLQAAADRFASLRARPYLERCERELTACGLGVPERREFDPSRLTAQELAVARLVAGGMSNRAVAAELFISIKTVQFHLTHIYSKLGLSTRAELAARLRDADLDGQ